MANWLFQIVLVSTKNQNCPAPSTSLTLRNPLTLLSEALSHRSASENRITTKPNLQNKFLDWFGQLIELCAAPMITDSLNDQLKRICSNAVSFSPPKQVLIAAKNFVRALLNWPPCEPSKPVRILLWNANVTVCCDTNWTNLSNFTTSTPSKIWL